MAKIRSKSKRKKSELEIEEDEDVVEVVETIEVYSLLIYQFTLNFR